MSILNAQSVALEVRSALVTLERHGGGSVFKLQSDLIKVAVFFDPYDSGPLIGFRGLALEYDDLPFREGIHSIHAHAKVSHVAANTGNDLISRARIEMK